MKVSFCDNDVVEMDTVKGVRETGKRLLTMIFRKNSVMLLFLMPDGKAESVKRVFDYLEAGLGLDVFRRLFPVILTDNGSEFKHVDGLEYSDELEYRTGISTATRWLLGRNLILKRTTSLSVMRFPRARV